MPPSWRSGTWLAPSSVEHTCIRPTGVGDGEGAEQWAYMPQEKIFLGQLSCKIRAFSGVNTANFSGKNHVKFENFVNF